LPLKGRGYEENWSLFVHTQQFPAMDDLAACAKYVLLNELQGFGAVKCTMCDGIGHSYKHCSTADRIEMLVKGSTVMSEIISWAKRNKANQGGDMNSYQRIMRKRLKPSDNVVDIENLNPFVMRLDNKVDGPPQI